MDIKTMNIESEYLWKRMIDSILRKINLFFMGAMLNNPQLNEQQLDMIRLLKKPLPEQYFLQVRRLIVELLGKQIDDTIDNWEKSNNISEQTYEDLSKGHFRTSGKKPE